MTERFEIFPQNVAKDGTLIIIKKGLKLYNISDVVELLNELNDENEQLRNRINDWHQRTFKAHEYFNILEKVIDEVCDDDISNQIWKEYEKREKLIE